ncbi:hypothetical protein EON65_17285 [archaeon]|nr:MAG: hypothetical protein EON65_17285 [archaeon]
MGGKQSQDSAFESTESAIQAPSYSLTIMDVIILCANCARTGNPVLPFNILYTVLKNYLGPYKLALSSHRESQYGNNANKVHMSFKVKKIPYFIPIAIELEVVSKDQGWSSYPDQHGRRSSSTWGELALSATHNERYHIYTNIHAGKALETHVKIFRQDQAVLKQLQQLWRSALEGEEVVNIQLIARSMHPGWVNTIADATITVVYSLTDDITELAGPYGRRRFKARFPPRYVLSVADMVVLLKNIARTRSRMSLPKDILFGILKDNMAKSKLTKVRKQEQRYGGNADQLYMFFPMRKFEFHVPISIEIQVDSKDQGWSSYPDEHGTRNSWTWGELALSTDPDTIERQWVYTNIHAGKEWEKQTMIFSLNDDLLQRLCGVLREADVGYGSRVLDLQLYVRSMYPGWENFIRYASISVEYRLASDALSHL